MRLLDLYRHDLDDQTATDAKLKVRRYWYRAVGLTIMERNQIDCPIPKRGTHGSSVERFRPFWDEVPDDQLDELFYYLKPFFATSERKNTEL